MVRARISSTITSSATPRPLIYPVTAEFTSFSTDAIETPDCNVTSSSKIISVTVGARTLKLTPAAPIPGNVTRSVSSP